MSNEIICQRLDELTVAIRRNLEETHTWGTGFVVSREGGLLVTCAHVVRDVCNSKPTVGLKVGVYFPRVTDETKKAQWATVVACLADYDDDVVLLKLDNGSAPLEQNPFELGQAMISFDKPFYSYGFGRTLKDVYLSNIIRGRISGQVDTSLNLRIRRFALIVENGILNGHSGSPILDMELNRIVGVIIGANNDIKSGMATDCAVLTIDTFAPFGLSTSNAPVAKEVPPRPRDDTIKMARSEVDAITQREPFGVPFGVPEEEWVGRAELLQILTDSWTNPTKRLTALIGFGGEGKTSLVQHWLSMLNPDAVFWWSFYAHSDADEFFEAAFRYLSDGQYNPKTNRAEKLGAFLYIRKYIFVLDGFEVMQRHDFDRYGDITHSDLQHFLEYFTSPAHESRCLITSRIPLIQFGHYPTFKDFYVDQLSLADGCSLLRKLGINDTKERLDAIGQKWEGHALTLTLIGTYLMACHQGKVVDLAIHVEDLPLLAADERRAKQVSRVLGRYDDGLLSQSEQMFLMIFSAFRLPVSTTAFSLVFRSQNISIFGTSLVDINDESFANLIERLKAYRIIRYDSNENHYTIHPLMRDHYSKRLIDDSISSMKWIHWLIKNYYLSITPQLFSAFTLKDLAPVVEAIYHACCAEAYDEAFNLYMKPIKGFELRSNIEMFTERPFYDILINSLGAYELARELLLGFFLERDTAGDVRLLAPDDKARILSDSGDCFKYLSQLEEANHLYKRAITIYQELANWGEMSTVYRKMTTLYISLGGINDSIAAAESALKLVTRPDDFQEFEAGEFQENDTGMVESLSLIGFIEMLQGEVEQADLSFAQAKKLSKENLQLINLPVRSGILFATYLWRRGERQEATDLTREYLKQRKKAAALTRKYLKVRDLVVERSQLHRILGNISATSGKHQDAEQNYTEAVKLARGFSRRDILIEALSARGRWAASQHIIELAHADLEEALHYARGGYRLYEADIRVGLAIMHLAEGDQERAHQEAQEAERISNDIGYHWGLRDANDVLRTIGAKQ